MGRRWGKTVLGGCLAISTAVEGGQVAWVVPTYRNGNAVWRFATTATTGLRQRGWVRVSQTDRVIEFVGGGRLGVYSAEAEDSIRGEAFHLVVLDEAARISQTAWQDVIQPALADADGDALLISTPRGRNWFWTEWLRGQDPAAQAEIVAWRAPSSDNPNPRIQRAAELARFRVPERTYRQEWLAEFAEDGGVLRRVREAATAEWQSEAIPGHRYAFGVDWGKHNDFTVISVLDLIIHAQVALDRFNQIDYVVQIGRLRALYDRFRPVRIIAEANAMGEPIIEQVARLGMPVRPFVTTSASKADAIEALALAFEQDALRILPDPVQLAELQAYQTERLPSGLLRYGAPEGQHDDCVMALALAWQAAVSGRSRMFAV